MNKIAVFLDQNKQLNHFYQCVYVQIYQGDYENFFLEKELSFEQIVPVSPKQIKEETHQLSLLAEGCVAVVFGHISGVAYSVFDGKQFYIFTSTDQINESVKGVYEDLEAFDQEINRKQESLKQAKPRETDIPGIYYLDLLNIQAEHPELSSKQVLNDFFGKIPFMELRLKASHVPPWIERDNRFDVVWHPIKDYVYCIVTNKQC